MRKDNVNRYTTTTKGTRSILDPTFSTVEPLLTVALTYKCSIETKHGRACSKDKTILETQS